MISDAFRQVLAELDIAEARRLWLGFAQASDAEVLAALHHARTQAQSVAFRDRAWSHCWLTDRELPSGLPDNLKPRAERLYPRVVSGVMIAVVASGPRSRTTPDHRVYIRERMEEVVLDAYATDRGEPDPEALRPRMLEARDRALKA